MAVNAAVSAAPTMRRTLTNTFMPRGVVVLLVHARPGGHDADRAEQGVGASRCTSRTPKWSTSVLTSTTTDQHVSVQTMTARSISARVRRSDAALAAQPARPSSSAGVRLAVALAEQRPARAARRRRPAGRRPPAAPRGPRRAGSARRRPAGQWASTSASSADRARAIVRPRSCEVGADGHLGDLPPAVGLVFQPKRAETLAGQRRQGQDAARSAATC